MKNIYSFSYALIIFLTNLCLTTSVSVSVANPIPSIFCRILATWIRPEFTFYLINRMKYFQLFDSDVGQTNLKKDYIYNDLIITPNSI